MEEKTPMSLLTTYDDLCRTAAVLTDGTAEHKFLKFVRSRENWRERWEAVVGQWGGGGCRGVGIGGGRDRWKALVG